MTTRSKLIVKHPRDELHTTLITRTWELAGHLDDIASAAVEQQSANSARHVWRAIPNIPAVLAPHVDDDHFSWTADVQWHGEDFESHWKIEPHALKEMVSCSAHVTLNEALGGRATSVLIEFELQGLDNRQGVETIAYRIVQVNWKKLVDAAVQKLSQD